MDTPPAKGTSKNIYLGADIYDIAEQASIDVESDIRAKVGVSKFVQHLVKHYSHLARDNWTRTLMADKDATPIATSDEDVSNR
jgi:hypothetical protein